MKQFEPRINVRVYPVVLWDHKPPAVLDDFRMRYGFMPDGTEVELGRTSTMPLQQAFDHYLMVLRGIRFPHVDWLYCYVLPYRDNWLPRHPVARLLALAGARRVKRWAVIAWRRVTGRKVLRIDGYEWAPLPALQEHLDKQGLMKNGPFYILKEGEHAASG